MNYTVELQKSKEPIIVRACDTNIGDLMIVCKDETYEGDILLHSYTHIISLTRPINIWSKDCPLKVRLLSSREQVILTVK